MKNTTLLAAIFSSLDTWSKKVANTDAFNKQVFGSIKTAQNISQEISSNLTRTEERVANEKKALQEAL